MILNVSPQAIIHMLGKTESSPIYYVESQEAILMVRRFDGFLLKAEYLKTGDENDLIFIESHLAPIDAVRVDGVEDDSPLGRIALTLIGAQMAELNDKMQELLDLQAVKE